MTATMKQAVRAIAALITLVGLALPASAQKRVALVIGNDSYQNVSPLRKAVNDAATMRDTLKKLGFQVLAAENLTRRDMLDRLVAFERLVKPCHLPFTFLPTHRSLSQHLPL